MSLSHEVYKEGGLLNGRYQKLEDISEGAYGIVSLAKDTKKSQLVAVKYIFKYQDESSPVKDSQYSKSLTSMTNRMDDDICEEALHEIEIHQKLGSHPNIISLVDCFGSFIILEYCPRGDLYESIRANMGPTSTTDIVNVALQLISAVEYAHSHSIYHRDIKPENILIADDFTIRLSDWGLASTKKMCRDFGVGSERYMAPELFDEENVEVYDASKCDIWSIGICLLNIVFHKNPFSVANQTDKSFSYFARNREALFDIFSTMSDDFFAVLRHSLTLDPENRDLGKLKEELLKVQRLTFDDDFYNFDVEKENKAKPITINAKATGGVPARHSTMGHRKNYKTFAVPTPNTHIVNHFHDFKKEEFNRSDFFTPPSVNAHFLEKFGADRKKPGVYQPPHQRPHTPKATSQLPSLSSTLPIPNLSPAKKSRKNSFNSFSSSVGKYIPPNLRSPNIMKSPLHESVTNIDDLDSDDDLFVLEEVDSRAESEVNLHELGNSIATLNIDDQNYSSELSSAPSLIVPTPLHNDMNKASSNTIHNRKPLDSKPLATEKKPYVPPHHRENYNSHWNHNPQNKKPSFWNHGQPPPSRARRMSGHKKPAFSSSVPTQKTDWFPPTKVEYEDDAVDDDDFEKSEFYKSFVSRVGERSDNALSSQQQDTKNNRLIRAAVREVGSLVD